MNFGQALAALLNGRRVSCDELPPGAFIARQLPAGAITEPFIALHRANGVCTPWAPTQEAILATNWANVGENQGQGAGETQRVGEHATSAR